MITRRFGRTELPMPVFSCGGMRYQQSWDAAQFHTVEEANQRNLEATILRALEAGITHIETARGYGTSEEQLGQLLPTLPRDEIIVQTKIPPNADPAEFRRQFEDSLRRLRLSHVDLLGLHGINNYTLHWQSVRPGGCLEVARQLQSEGKVRHVGFSTHGEPQQIVDTINTDAFGGFDYVNLHWYYIYQHNWPAIAAATRRDMGVFIISPADKGGMLYKPPAKLVELTQPLHPLVFNCLFCLSRPEIHTLSVGASCPSDFNLQLSTLPHLAEAADVLPPIVERLESAWEAAIGRDAKERFREGLPHWETAPGYMNIPVMLWLRQLALAFGLVEYGQMRYNLLGNGGHWFPGLNAAHLDSLDPEKLTKAVEKSPFASRVPQWLRETHKLLGGAEVKRLSQS